MSEDGISYLDIGDAYLRGDWQMALNSVWSPLYGLILGVVMRISNPIMKLEFPVVHLVNFAIFLGTLLCFEFFWRRENEYRVTRAVDISGNRRVGLPEWAWISLGYALFIWSSLSLIRIWTVTPDMLMAALVYLAAGLVLRIRSGQDHWLTFVLLGIVLGLGYLAKSVMFPLALVFLAISFFSVSKLRRRLPRLMVALIVFLLCGAPYIAAISLIKNRLTFGDAGTLTYVRYVNRVPYPHWQGQPVGSGIPKHPSREILEEPPIYEFGSPVGGTYPISYDPSYWYEGVVPHVNVSQQIALTLASATFYLDIFLHQLGVLVFSVFILYIVGIRRQGRIDFSLRGWGLAVVALVAFGMYALVYVEGRYIGVFVTLLCGDLLSNLSLPKTQTHKRLVSAMSAAMVIFMLLNILFFNLEGIRGLMGWGEPRQLNASQAQTPSWPGEVAEELHALGIEAGDKVAIIGYGFGAFWARLARVQIVAEMLGWQADDFWSGDLSLQSEALQAFASTGAKALVAEHVPSYASLDGWDQVGQSNYYIYVLTR
ncbi:MAG TPA: hypothetical protein VE136_02685 [Anaerolineales bacterium]|jgi:hypothetical protein|nr:hypothetical protein [Anaerolineales bacterium]